MRVANELCKKNINSRYRVRTNWVKFEVYFFKKMSMAKEKKTERIFIRVSEKEKQAIKRDARAQKTDLSKYILKQILEQAL